MICVGIDPGKNGSIVALRNGKAKVCRMTATERDVVDFLTDIDVRASFRGEPVFCMLERMQPMPRSERGVVAGFKLGVSYGFLRGILVAVGIRFEEVQAAKWQRAMGIPRIEGETDTAKKNRHKGRAQQLFPEVTIVHAVADALLIAEYCRRTLAERGDA